MYSPMRPPAQVGPREDVGKKFSRAFTQQFPNFLHFAQVLNYQDKLVQSGDADMCYYNFLCSIPVGDVIDFNHIFSNVGYLFFGLLFLILTAYKVIS